MNYKVVTPVKPRASHNMWDANTKPLLPIGYTFVSSSVVTELPNPPILGQTGPITWVKLPDLYWVPMVYKGVTYVVEVPPTPVGEPFTLTVQGYKTVTGILEPEA